MKKLIILLLTSLFSVLVYSQFPKTAVLKINDTLYVNVIIVDTATIERLTNDSIFTKGIIIQDNQALDNVGFELLNEQADFWSSFGVGANGNPTLAANWRGRGEPSNPEKASPMIRLKPRDDNQSCIEFIMSGRNDEFTDELARIDSFEMKMTSIDLNMNSNNIEDVDTIFLANGDTIFEKSEGGGSSYWSEVNSENIEPATHDTVSATIMKPNKIDFGASANSNNNIEKIGNTLTIDVDSLIITKDDGEGNLVEIKKSEIIFHDDITADDFILSSAKTEYLALTTIGVTTYAPDVDDIYKGNAAAGVSSGTVTFYWELNLPHGATVTSCTVYGTATSKSWQLQRGDYNNGVTSLLTANVGSADSSPTFVVDNNSYNYLIQVGSVGSSDGVLYGAKVTYTIQGL